MRTSSPGLTCRRNLTFSIAARKNSPGLPVTIRTTGPSALGHGLDEDDTGHNRVLGKVSGEKEIRIGELAISDDLILVRFFHPVDKEERLAVREEVFDVLHARESITGGQQGKEGGAKSAGYGGTRSESTPYGGTPYVGVN